MKNNTSLKLRIINNLLVIIFLSLSVNLNAMKRTESEVSGMKNGVSEADFEKVKALADNLKIGDTVSEDNFNFMRELGLIRSLKGNGGFEGFNTSSFKDAISIAKWDETYFVGRLSIITGDKVYYSSNIVVDLHKASVFLVHEAYVVIGKFFHEDDGRYINLEEYREFPDFAYQ